MTVTLKDIAEKVGISVTTVSRALGGYSDVSSGTRERVITAANTMGYTPNVIARRLQKQRTDTLGFIMPTFGPRFADPFFSEFIAGISNEAAKHGFDLIVSTHAPDSEPEQRAYQRAVQGGWVDGLIVVRTREDDFRIRFLTENNFPFVSFGRTKGVPEFPYVDEDSFAGMKLLVQHFIDLGHRQIGFISPPKGLLFGQLRREAYQATLQENGISPNPNWIVYGELTQGSGEAAAKKLLNASPRPSAIIGGNDLMAIGAMKAIREQGLHVGKDIAVGGFDDIPLSTYTHPPLTTVHQPIYKIGKQTCSMLINIALKQPLDERHVLLTPSLVTRASSGSHLNNHQV